MSAGEDVDGGRNTDDVAGEGETVRINIDKGFGMGIGLFWVY